MMFDNIDETKVSLSVEERKKATSLIAQMMSSLDCLRNYVTEGNLINDNVATHLGLDESYHRELSSILGYDSILAKENAARYVEIKKANCRIRELENQLGVTVSADAVCGALQLYHDIFRAWYSNEGFRYASIETTQWGINATFSSEIHRTNECEYPSNPIYVKLWSSHKGMEQKITDGWNIFKAQFHGELLDTDNNKVRFQQLIMKDFPNARISGFGSRRNDYGTFSMRPEVNIPYGDISELYTRATKS